MKNHRDGVWYHTGCIQKQDSASRAEAMSSAVVDRLRGALGSLGPGKRAFIAGSAVSGKKESGKVRETEKTPEPLWDPIDMPDGRVPWSRTECHAT